MTTIELNIDVVCYVCSEALVVETETDYYHKTSAIKIHPCSNCLKEAKEESRKEGYDEGLSDGEGEV